jgi:hypothetical protein
LVDRQRVGDTDADVSGYVAPLEIVAGDLHTLATVHQHDVGVRRCAGEQEHQAAIDRAIQAGGHPQAHLVAGELAL